MPLKDLTGQKFGHLQVICRVKSRKGHTKFLCQCKCGARPRIYSTHLLRGNTKSCGCQTPKGPQVYNWKGYGEISGNKWDSVRNRGARSNRQYRRNLPFTITIKYAWELFLSQGRKCALTGDTLYFGDAPWSNTASLDRIDSSKGYVRGNVQWVHKDVNRMKNVYKQIYFIEICKKVANKCEVA